MKTLIILLTMLVLPLGSTAFAKERTLISKCAYGASNGGIEIEVGTLYSYVFGERHLLSDGTVRIDNFEVQHEIATVRDDIRTPELPEFDQTKVFPAEFAVDPVTNETDYFAAKWKHPAIGGKAESKLPGGTIGYWEKSKWVNSTQGITSALAMQSGQFGGYPHCMIFGMPGGQ